MKKLEHSRGFTIVELLIVIVVIGILAGIAIVSYIGVQSRAVTTGLVSDLRSSAVQLELDKVNNGSYPSTAAGANNGKGLPPSSRTTYNYSYNSSARTYCLEASADSGVTFPYHVSSTSTVPQAGSCNGAVFALTIANPLLAISSEPVTITGTGPAGHFVSVGVCDVEENPGSKCGGAEQSTTISGAGTWTVDVTLFDSYVFSTPLYGSSPRGLLTCGCQIQAFDFGSTTSPTSVSQAIASSVVDIQF